MRLDPAARGADRRAVSPSSARTIAGAYVADVALVTLFAATGRASHREDVIGGLMVTAWPFAVALTVGWLVTRAWRHPFAPLRTGAMLWVVTVAGGMLLRVVSDQGVQAAFVTVAATMLGALLIGWRAVATLVVRRRRRRGSRRSVGRR
jgi:hypothetical protein